MSIKFRESVVCSAGLMSLIASLAVAQPIINGQPANQFLAPGSAALFSVSATGTGTITYQWLFDGAPITSATNPSYSIASPTPAQCGYYSVIVSDPSGSVTSQVAELKVFAAAPHSVGGIAVGSNGSADLTLSGETTSLFGPYYDMYPLQASPDLMHWTSLGILQRSNAALAALGFVDTNAPSFSQRFYRTATNQLATPDPLPTGPYSIGTFSMLLTNTSRNNTEFMITVWYPAAAQAAQLPALYMDPQYVQAGRYNLATRDFTPQVSAFYAHAQSNAPIATNLTAYPIVLYDPGLNGHRRENTDKVEELASWGYVVVGLDTSDTTISVFPDGTVVHGSTSGNLQGRMQDLQFVMDELAVLNGGDPLLGGHLDLDKLGMFGWSFGGATAAQLCLADSRCKAAAAMDGVYGQANLLTQAIGVPWLYLRSGDAPDPGPANTLSDGRPDDRLQIFHQQVTNAYWVKLDSTVHGSFDEADLITDPPTLNYYWGTPMSGQFTAPARQTQIVRAYLLSFFNKFLKGQDDHLLDAPSTAFPEVLQFLSMPNFSTVPEYPAAGLVQGNDGNFYGTTEFGGTNGDGTVFRITPTGVRTTLVSFNGSNGGWPLAALVQGDDGNFYGTTSGGGAFGDGTVFQMAPGGALTTLVSFDGGNGSTPFSGLMQGTNGNFYGTTVLGGANNRGTVFTMTAAGSLTTLFSFSGGNGSWPWTPLVQGTDGNLYGTTSHGGAFGGAFGYGTAFKMTPAGALTTLVSFQGATTGAFPLGRLVQGSDGNFYGTTAYGGNRSLNGGNGLGTIFRMTPAGGLTPLVTFNSTNGSFCTGGLVQANDGNFYGATRGGGAGGGGTIFRMTSTGSFTTLFAFHGSNGSNPLGPLAQGNDGTFYGVTEYGGTNALGTVFQITTNGTLTTLDTF